MKMSIPCSKLQDAYRSVVCQYVLVAFFVIALPVAAHAQMQLDADEVWTSFNGHNRTQPLFDEDTLVAKWRAFEVDNAPKDRVTTATPAVRKNYELTGETKPPVRVLRMSEGSPRLSLSFGELGIGVYAVRFIGMVNTEDIVRFRKPVYIEMIVTPESGGKPERYRHRVPYWDDFYSVTELYFMVDKPGRFNAEVYLGERTLVDFQLNRIELHNMLAPLAGKAVKQKVSTFNLRDRAALRESADREAALKEIEIWTRRLDPYLRDPKSPSISTVERQQRDDAMWQSLVPLNSMITSYFPLGYNDKNVLYPPVEDPRAFSEEFGVWRWQNDFYAYLQPLTISNAKLGLTYDRDDFENFRLLPKPYPHADDGAGVYFPPTGDSEQARNSVWLAWLVSLRERNTLSLVAPTDGSDVWHHLPYLYHAFDDERAARDAAFMLAAYAYRYPTMTQSRDIYESLEGPTGNYNRDVRLDRRYLAIITHVQQGLAQSYDMLFDYIKGNDELAKAVGRYIPWIKTEKDLRRMIETRVLQFGARQSMKFNIYSDKDTPVYLFRTALIQQDPETTEPWMASLWKKTWIYPHRDAGLPDYVSSTMQRDGSTDIGSIFYTGMGSRMGELALWSKTYVENGGNPKYDLTDPGLYGKLRAAGSFILDQTVAGGFPMAIGDVGDPYKPRMTNVSFSTLGQQFRDGYRMCGDPRMAWMIEHYFGRGAADDKTWQQIQSDAAKAGSNPLLTPNPRVMANWAGILEHSAAPNDFRFLTSIQIRIGTGHGHSHSDTLDLQMNAHGVRSLNDLCWRGAYSMPNPKRSQLHNVVEVDDIDWEGHAWIDAFAPSNDVSFMRARATPTYQTRQVKARNRSAALIAVDDGNPGTQQPTPLPYTSKTRFDPAAVMPNSYVFNVQRISGGMQHTWCFHGTISDGFDVNVINRTPDLPTEESTYMRRFLNGDDYKYAGDSPDTIVATWRLRRSNETLDALTRDHKPISMPQVNAEQRFLEGTYDESAPRRFTRVHLPIHETQRLMVGNIQPSVPSRSDTWPFLFAQRRSSEPIDSVFASIVEPYAGEPFVESVEPLKIADNEDDYRRAVAVKVTLKDGREDICFSDDAGAGSDSETRSKRRRFGAWQIEGAFAFVRTDDKGLQRAKLVEGTKLYTKFGALNVTRAAYVAKVEQINYLTRQVKLSTSWSDGNVVGEQVEFGNSEHRTSYTVIAAERKLGKLTLTLDKALDLSYAHIVKVDVEKQLVYVNIQPLEVLHLGKNAGLTCTVDEDFDKSFKCSVVTDGAYKIDRPFTEKDFPVGSVLRLWEFGDGDEARMPTHADVTRNDDGSYTVTSNGNVTWRPR